MTRNLIGAALGALLLVAATPARAESEWVKIFDVEGEPKVARLEVARVTKLCDFHVMSRMGPDPRELAACEGAMKGLAARGTAAAPAVMAAIDREETPFAARFRLYAALAATGDRAIAERMIDALAKLATTDEANLRDHEAHEIDATAEAILRVTPEERAPWSHRSEVADGRRWTNRVFAWRALLRDNPGATPDQLEAARLARARAEQASPDLERAFIATRYLVEKDPVAGGRAAEALAKRIDEAPAEARELARGAIEHLKRQAEQQRRSAAEQAAERDAAAQKKTQPVPGRSPLRKPIPTKAPSKADPASRS